MGGWRPGKAQVLSFQLLKFTRHGLLRKQCSLMHLSSSVALLLVCHLQSAT